jgi:hypothetical protein
VKITISFLVFLSVATLFFCQSPETAKKASGTKYLHVTFNIPDNLIFEVRTDFRSIPTCWGCKSLSEQSWNWVPLAHMEIYFASPKDKEICVPLFINKTTVCKWILHNADVGILQRKDSLEEAGFCIYPKADTELVKKHENLIDTMCYTCYKCINQFMLPPDNEVFIRCDRLAPNEEDHSYTYEGIHGDTAHVTVVAHNDSGPIRYMDTTLTSDNKFRVFGKDEKIPGLN